MRRRLEHPGTRAAPARNLFEGGHARSEPGRKPTQQKKVLRYALERNLLHISAALFFVGSVGWCWLIYNEFRSPVLIAPAEAAYAVTAKVDANVAKSDSFGISTYLRNDHPQVSALAEKFGGTETAARIVADEWGRFESLRVADRGRAAAKHPAKHANIKPLVRLASLESDAPQGATYRAATKAVPLHIRPNIGAETSLVDFETAPFPYHGLIPGSNRPFLNAGEDGHRGHSNFRGHVYWESQTFSDDRVLLHIPPSFDPTRPAVMVVFFHGHGANLARDVRDRQQVPAQITE